MFEPTYPIAKLKGADYNPRFITDAEFSRLRESVRELGVLKPIIATPEIIVAGHQRTRALKAEGLAAAPVYLLEQISKTDEIRFNQLHNGTDVDSGDEAARVPACETVGRFIDVPPGELKGNPRSKLVIVRHEICRMLNRYGEWGAVVADASGRVIHAAQYLLACKVLQRPCRVIYVADAPKAARYLGAAYGSFSYSHLPRTPYAQTWAQMYRLRGGKKENRSALYEGHVLEALKPGERLLDFGCGQGDYLNRLKGQGFKAWGFEPFFRLGNRLNPAAVTRMGRELFRALRQDGLFDVVVCDSVLNSVDRTEAHDDVLRCLSAFCRPGGRVYFSGRLMERVESLARNTLHKGKNRYIEFLDGQGFTALYRRGNWVFQRFHSVREAQRLAQGFFGKLTASSQSRTSWQMAARKTQEIEPEAVEASLRREFDLSWPGGRSMGLGEEAVQAWREAMLMERSRN